MLLEILRCRYICDDGVICRENANIRAEDALRQWDDANIFVTMLSDSGKTASDVGKMQLSV